MKVYLVAGEPSGDKLGAELMAGLKSCAPYELDFCGVGGFLMEEQGLTSLFPISEIAVMGIGEILAKYSFLKKRIKNTVDDIDSMLNSSDINADKIIELSKKRSQLIEIVILYILHYKYIYFFVKSILRFL